MNSIDFILTVAGIVKSSKKYKKLVEKMQLAAFTRNADLLDKLCDTPCNDEIPITFCGFIKDFIRIYGHEKAFELIKKF
ncbi:MAG: hypothetical protein QXW79_02405 [Thermoplasmata archaeon]